MGFFALAIFGTWVIWEAFGDAPSALVNLLGPTVGVWFASAASDRNKKDREVEGRAQQAQDSADRANLRATHLEVARDEEHPGHTEPHGKGRGDD